MPNGETKRHSQDGTIEDDSYHARRSRTAEVKTQLPDRIAPDSVKEEPGRKVGKSMARKRGRGRKAGRY